MVICAAAFVTVTSGQFTLIGTGPALLFPCWAAASLLAATWAELLMTGQLAAVVVAVRVMVRDWPAATVPKLQVSRAPPATGLGAQSPPLAPPTAQPGAATLLGTVSVRVTLVASPGPRLVTVMVKVATPPALMVGWAAAFATVTSGQFTLIGTGPASLLPCWAAASLVAATWAEILMTGQLAGVVVAVRVIVRDWPAATVPKL